MFSADEYSGALVPQRREFDTTHWSVVLAARGESADAQEALEKLCRVYWYPLYAFVRRQGHSPEDAEDLIQGFFARLLQRKDLETVQRERGRFRSYLLVSLKHFMVNEQLRARRKTRGRAVAHLSGRGRGGEEIRPGTRGQINPGNDLRAALGSRATG